MTTRRDFMKECFIVDTVDGTWLAFQLMPDSLRKRKTVNWSEQTPLGRSVPIAGYAGSSAKEVALQMQFADDLGTADPYNLCQVRNTQLWLESFAYPDYTGGLIAPPHPVYVKCGNMIEMYGRITDVEITFSAPWDFDALHSRIIEATVNILEIASTAPDLYDIRTSFFPALSGSSLQAGAHTTGHSASDPNTKTLPGREGGGGSSAPSPTSRFGPEALP